jgi:hypothetical protein
MARDREYEKQARAYTRFIVQNGKAVGGWEYAEDAKDELRAMKDEGRLGDARIVARASLAKYGIDPKQPFAVAPKGPASGFGKEKTAADFRARIAWEKHAAATQRRLGHEAHAGGHDHARVAYERELEGLRATKHESGNNPKLRGGKKTDIVFHKDGSATSWNVHTQSFSRMRRGKVSDELLSSLSSEERERVTRHLYADSRKAMLTDLGRAKHIANPVEREAKVSQLRGALQDIGATEAEIRKALSSSPSAAKHESGNNPRVARALKTRIDRLIGKRKR